MPENPIHLPRRANFYESGPLDRLSDLRADAAWIEAQLRNAASRFFPVWRMQNLVVAREEARPVFLSGSSPIVEQAEAVVFLGVHQEIAHFAVDLSHHDDPPLAEHGEFLDLRAVGPLLGRDEGSILAYARGLVHWHQRHRYCGVCGSPTRSVQGGHVRQCIDDSCRAQHFPRTDPAVIMLVHDGADHAILGRSPRFPPGMRSTLAGFVEPGESLEDAVAREVMEEVGVRVRNVTYHSSQPWPFPSSIMLGFYAEAVDGALRVNNDELEDAAWFSRQELMNSPEDEGLRLPRRDSIARRLIEDWLGRDWP